MCYGQKTNFLVRRRPKVAIFLYIQGRLGQIHAKGAHGNFIVGSFI